MYIGSPIHTLDIIPSVSFTEDQHDGDIQCILRLNQTKNIAKGTKDYCIDTRREILFNRGLVVPQDWEIAYNWHLGPVWTPDLMEGIHIWCDHRGIYTDTTETDHVTRWESQLNTTEYFSQLYTINSPTVSSGGENGFKKLVFAGSEWLIIPPLRHEDDVTMTINLNPGPDAASAAGKGDFIVGIVGHYPRVTGFNSAGIIANGTGTGGGTARSWSILADTSTGHHHTLAGIRVLHADTVAMIETETGTNGSAPSMQILIMAKLSGTTYLRLGGQATDTSPTASQNCDEVTYGDDDFGILGKAAKNFKGDMHEVVFAKGPTLGISDVEKLEGYFADKYNILTPTANTTYSSTNPPRQGAGGTS